MNDPVAWTIASIPVAIVLYLWTAAALSAVFRKAGEEPWKAWVPVLNAVVLLQLGGMSGWLLLLGLIPVLGQLALLGIFIVVYIRLNRSFGVGQAMTVLAVLLLPVWASVLGWGPARWLGDRTASNGPVRRSTGNSVGARDADPLDARVGGAYGVGAGASYGARAGAYEIPVAPSSVPSPPAYTPVYSPAPLEGGASVVGGSRADAAVAFSAADPFVPPRPPAPAAASGPAGARSSYTAPSAPADAPADQWSFAPPPSVEDESLPPRRPTFRSTAVGVNPAFDDMDDDGTGGVRFAPPPPVSSVPGAGADGTPDPWAPPAAAAAADPDAPMRRASWAPSADGSFDTSAEVSAVQGAPRLGEPLSARGSVSAQHGVPEIPDAEAAFDETIIGARRRPAWMLTPPLGTPIAVTSDALIVGRRPSADPDFPDAQLVPISDETRTMSKTHARLELLGDEWVIVDLDSTNGVLLFREDGTETEASPGIPERVGERFLLGDAELRLARTDSR